MMSSARIQVHRVNCRHNFASFSASRLHNPTSRKRLLLRSACRAANPEDDDYETRLRSEAEAPFRPVRLAVYGTLAFSSSIGLLINLTQIIGAINETPGAKSVIEVLQNLGIDAAFVVGCALLIRSDLQAQKKQMARLSREQKLGDLKISLSDKNIISLREIRGNARVVILAGSGNQIIEAMKPAEELREQLMKCATYIVQAPILGDEGDLQTNQQTKTDLRWKGTAIGKNEWLRWFKDQMEEAGVTEEKAKERGLYVGLRMDGRVRSSGLMHKYNLSFFVVRDCLLHGLGLPMNYPQTKEYGKALGMDLTEEYDALTSNASSRLLKIASSRGIVYSSKPHWDSP